MVPSTSDQLVGTWMDDRNRWAMQHLVRRTNNRSQEFPNGIRTSVDAEAPFSRINSKYLLQENLDAVGRLNSVRSTSASKTIT